MLAGEQCELTVQERNADCPLLCQIILFGCDKQAALFTVCAALPGVGQRQI